MSDSRLFQPQGFMGGLPFPIEDRDGLIIRTYRDFEPLFLTAALRTYHDIE